MIIRKKQDMCFGKFPYPNFTSRSDIDWPQPLPEIDLQLYDKYSLSIPERHFIESMIKPMG